ncbi:nitroreductase family protein [Bifidobacterium biavatii]|uniref:Nitroreductase n=1 Tax=Bifidobacterium biavatii DSM 23969 TaxID=1437608 RepID=A0A086ZT05_9BIFI|nr:nitroreductase family protein [Bifidobacterium biavatii]KFI49655.1 nitroreductase [Bifidobacterium biavatii DSM 23969]
MGLKNVIKSMLPESFLIWTRRKRSFHTLRRNYLAQAKRFSRWEAYNGVQEIGGVEARMIFYTHQLEKGFTFDHYGYGRGKVALQHLSRLFGVMKRIDPQWHANDIYREAISALAEYRARHLDAGKDITFLQHMMPSDVWQDIVVAPRGNGFMTITAESKSHNKEIGFAELAEHRHSVRSFREDVPITHEQIEEAVHIALRSPSVCNRQPARIRLYTNPDLVSQILKLQGGFGGYACPPGLLLITADLRAFMSENERNEAYVDGGLFGMSMLYALEYESIAACPLNAMFYRDVEEKTRQLLGIPDYEVFIMYIAVGHFPNKTFTCTSHRFTINKVFKD